MIRSRSDGIQSSRAGRERRAGRRHPRAGQGGRHDQHAISRSWSSRPTRRRSKCPRRSPASSRKSRSRRATRSQVGAVILDGRRRQPATARRARQGRAKQPQRRAGRAQEPPQPERAGTQHRPATATAKAAKPSQPRQPKVAADAAPCSAEAPPRQWRTPCAAPGAAGAPAPASPSVRRLAREIGVDINEVQGTGPAAAFRRRTSRSTRAAF